MTKHIRIENADLTNHKVKILIQDKQYNPETMQWDGDWRTTESHKLDSPTQMSMFYISAGRRIVIEENGQ